MTPYKQQFSTLLYKFERIFPLFVHSSMYFHSSVLIFGFNLPLFYISLRGFSSLPCISTLQCWFSDLIFHSFCWFSDRIFRSAPWRETNSRTLDLFPWSKEATFVLGFIAFLEIYPLESPKNVVAKNAFKASWALYLFSITSEPL